MYTYNITVSFSNIPLFNRIVSLGLYVKLTTFPSSSNNIFLMDGNTNVSKGSPSMYSGTPCLVFNIVNWFYVSNCPTQKTFTISSDVSLSLTQYYPFYYLTFSSYTSKELAYKKDNPSIELDIGNYISYSQDISTSSFVLNKKLFNDVHKYHYALTYNASCYKKQFHFFPKGWRINILEELVINTSYIYLYDRNNHTIYFGEVTDSNGQYYYDVNGSGLILEKIVQNNVTQYKLYSALKDNDYKLFNNDGHLIKIHQEDGGEILVNYSTNSITISDYINNDTISISYIVNNDNTSITISSSLLSLTHTLAISSNLLTSISHTYDIYNEVASAYYYVNKYDTFSYEFYDTASNPILNQCISSDNYKLLLTYNAFLIKKVSYYHVGDSVSKKDEYQFSYQVNKTVITSFHQAKTYYLFTNDNKLTASGEEIVNPETTNDKDILDLNDALIIQKENYSISSETITKYILSKEENIVLKNYSSSHNETRLFTSSNEEVIYYITDSSKRFYTNNVINVFLELYSFSLTEEYNNILIGHINLLDCKNCFHK